MTSTRWREPAREMGSSRFVLGRYRCIALTFEGGDNGMPGEDGAFDPGWEFVDAGENGEFADIAFDLTRGDEIVDLSKHPLHFLP